MRTIALALAVTILATFVAAQDEPRRPRRPATDVKGLAKQLKGVTDLDVEYAAGHWTSDTSENLRWARIVLTEGIAIRAGVTIVRADTAVIWFDPEIARQERERKKKKDKGEAPGQPAFTRDRDSAQVVNHRAVHGIYAEGDVHLQHGTQVVRAERVYFDVIRKRAVLVDGLVTGAMKPPPPRRAGRPTIETDVPFVLRAERLRVEWTDNLIGQTQTKAKLARVEAERVRVTTCDFGCPHYHIEASSFDMTVDDDTERPIFDLDSTTLNVFDQSVFWLPGLSGDTSIIEYFPLRGISIGDSKKFGTELETTWGDAIRFRDATGHRREWGAWELELDNRTRRGPGVGLSLDYATDDYYGTLLGYYQRDDTTDLSGPPPPFVPPNEDRGRFRAFHRHDLGLGLELDVEAAWLSDRNFLREYYEAEQRNGKIQENYGYLKRDYRNTSVRLLYRPRINEFYTRTEYLPRLSATAISQPLVPGGVLGTNLYLDVDAEAASMRLRFDEALMLRDREANRGDAIARVEMPVPIGPVHINPFFQTQYTSYSELAGTTDNDARLALTGGLRVFTQFWRVYPQAILGFDARHLVMPEIRYTNTYSVDLPPSQVILFDRKDFVTEFEAITARLQQKVQVQLGKTTLDVAELTIENVFFPEDDRDNGGRSASPMFVEFQAGTLRYRFLAEAQYDWYENDAVVLNTGFLAGLGRIPGIEPSRVKLFLGHRMTRGISNVLTLGTIAQIGPKWGFQGRFQYDYRNNRTADQRYHLYRTFHRFKLGTEIYVDGSNGDRGIRFTFAPIELFNSLTRIEREAQQGIYRGDY